MGHNSVRKINIVFICSGNICRSPMAEAVFKQMVEQAGLADRFEIASAGIGDWHLGEPPHPGTLDALHRHAVQAVAGKRAQVVNAPMLARADYLIAMDEGHARELQSFAGATDGKVSRLLDYAPQVVQRNVPDPYYSERYEEVYSLVEAGSRGLLEHILRKERL